MFVIHNLPSFSYKFLIRINSQIEIKYSLFQCLLYLIYHTNTRENEADIRDNENICSFRSEDALLAL